MPLDSVVLSEFSYCYDIIFCAYIVGVPKDYQPTPTSNSNLASLFSRQQTICIACQVLTDLSAVL